MRSIKEWLKRSFSETGKSLYVHLLWWYSTVLGRTTVIIAVALITIIILSTILFSHIEKVKLFEAAYWALITVTTVGYGDVVPKTGQGKLLAMALAVTGFAGLTAALSVATHFIVERAIREREGELRVKGTRIMIVGSSNVCALIASYLKEEAGKRGRIVWVTSYETPGKYVAKAREAGVPVVRGSLTEMETYLRGGIETATHVIICGRDDREALSSLAIVNSLIGKSIYPPKVVFVAKSKRSEKLALQDFEADVVVSFDSIGYLFKESLTDPTAAMFLSALSEEHPKLIEVKLIKKGSFLVAKVAHHLYLLGRRGTITAYELSEILSSRRKKKLYAVAKIVGLESIRPIRPSDYLEPEDIVLAVEFED